MLKFLINFKTIKTLERNHEKIELYMGKLLL